jgi:nicotinamidase-related amidase
MAHPAQQRHPDHRARRFPHQLLRRVDHANRYEHGYKVITLNDCLAATSIEEHENALTYDFPMFSEPMSSSAFIEQLG